MKAVKHAHVPLLLALLAVSCFSDPATAGATGDDDDTSGGTQVATSVAPSASMTSTSAGASSSSATSDATGSGEVGPGPTSGPGTSAATRVEVSTTTGSETGSTTAVESSDTVLDGPCAGRQHVAYIDFDGAMLTQTNGGPDDAPADQVARSSAVGMWNPYTGTDQATILMTADDAYSEYDLCLTDVRPMSGVYQMVVVSSDANPLASALLANFNHDCDNSNPSDVQILFLRNELTLDSQTRGYALASILGFGLGLDTVDPGTAPNSIMKNGYADNEIGLSFTTACDLLVPGLVCSPYPGCPNDRQNAAMYLAQTLGRTP